MIKVTAQSMHPKLSDFNHAFSKMQVQARKKPYNVGIIPTPIWLEFLTAKTPFEKEFWIAEDENTVDHCVGRIGVSLSQVSSDAAHVGFFEVDLSNPNAEAVAKELLAAVKAWALSRGKKELIGPLNWNTWFPYRFLVKSDNREFFAWEPVNPPEYPAFFESFGFTPTQEYHSVGVNRIDELYVKTKGDYDSLLSKRYAVRPFLQDDFLTREVPILYEISMEGFKSNYLFEPISLREFQAIYVPIANKVDLSLSHFAVSPEGKEVGFFLIFPEGKSMVMKSTTVLPAHRGLGISNALTHISSRKAMDLGCNRFIPALVKAGAQSESYAKKGKPEWEHRYSLFSYKM